MPTDGEWNKITKQPSNITDKLQIWYLSSRSEGGFVSLYLLGKCTRTNTTWNLLLSWVGLATQLQGGP